MGDLRLALAFEKEAPSVSRDECHSLTEALDALSLSCSDETREAERAIRDAEMGEKRRLFAQFSKSELYDQKSTAEANAQAQAAEAARMQAELTAVQKQLSEAASVSASKLAAATESAKRTAATAAPAALQ